MSSRLLRTPLLAASLFASLMMPHAAAIAQTDQPEPAKKPAAAAAPATSSQPQATTATYGDWVVRCATTTEPKAAKICEAAIGIQAQDRAGLLAQLVVGQPDKEQPARVIAQVPNGVFLPAGATLFLDDKAKTGISMVFATCTNGCFADAELKAEQIAMLKAVTGPARLEFVDGARNRVAIPISLNGVNPALSNALGSK